MDDRKTSIRNTGAVYTPIEVATSLVKWCLNLMDGKSLNVLEPSVGDGSFLASLSMIKADSKKVTAIDIDERVIADLRCRYHDQADKLKFLESDFVRYASELAEQPTNFKKFNLIVGNPPFIRRHNFSPEMKCELEIFSSVFDYPLQRIKNTWTAFLIASTQLVTDDGIVAFVLPYELLTVDYGQKALNYVQQQFERVDIFVSKKKAFGEIDQDAVILIAQKRSTKKPGFFITKVAGFAMLTERGARKIDFTNGAQCGIELNSFLLPVTSVKLLKKIQANINPVSTFVSSAPGVVSAANDFFIRTKADIEKLGLTNYAKPILKKGSFASKNPVFTSAEFEELTAHEPCFLLHLSGERGQLSPAANAYIKSGEKQKLQERYKCRNRVNWYQVPLVEPEKAFFFKRSHSHPRVLLNDAETLTTDTAYGLRLKGGYSARGFCFSFYTSLTMLFAEMNGRFYGGGVLELSPTEFRSLPLVYHEPTDAEFAKFLRAHKAADGDIHAILDFGDKWLSAKGHLVSSDLRKIRSGWAAIRSHRMRHGGRSAPQ